MIASVIYKDDFHLLSPAPVRYRCEFPSSAIQYKLARVGFALLFEAHFFEADTRPCAFYV